MKFLSCLVFLSVHALLSGCVTSVNYDLNEFNPGELKEPKIIDTRVNPRLESWGERPATLHVGEKSYKPSLIELLSKKFQKHAEIEKISSPNQIELTSFDLLIYLPRKQAQLSGMGMAGASYLAAIMTESMLTPRGDVNDGVISKITIKYKSEKYSCESFIEAVKEIDALYGYSMSGIEIQKSYDLVIENCVIDLVRKAGISKNI